MFNNFRRGTDCRGNGFFPSYDAHFIRIKLGMEIMGKNGKSFHGFWVPNLRNERTDFP